MKIAFVTWQFPALSNTFILNEIVEVKKRGHEVAIYSIDRSNDSVVHCDVERFGLLENTWFLQDFVPAERPDDDQFDEYRGDWFNDRVHGFAPMAAHMLEQGVDLVHGCFANNSSTMAVVTARLAGLPYTFECHAFDLFCDFKYSDEKLRRAERIFSISEYNRRYMVDELGCDDDKIRIRRVPILKEFADEIDAGDRDPGLVVTVARLTEIKGHDLALRAIAEVAKDIPETRYVIVGSGEDRETLEQQARDLGIDDRVQFAGTMTNREALQLVRRAQAFVLPSRIGSNGDRDGIPTSMIEAMYLRTPCVSTRVSGIPELVTDGENGFLADPEDVAALTAGLRQILSDPGRRAELGEAARARVLDEFDCDKNIDGLIAGWAEVKDRRYEPEGLALCRSGGRNGSRGFWGSVRGWLKR